MCEDINAEILWEILIKRELTNDDSIKQHIDQIKQDIYCESSSDCQ
ncbi:hypothetical protein [Bacillus cereus]|nr:hypothetical protein [Bacillus cereus]MBJ8025856.1 hypothetical protein [Bacillus cereus]MBJ8035470.1 hypothetical protein [Bacillus cereus]